MGKINVDPLLLRRKSCCIRKINGHFLKRVAFFLGSRDGLEDPLEDTGLVQQQLDQLSTIGRCEYEKTCALLVQLFDQSAQSYQELLQSASASPMDIAVQEGKCSVQGAQRYCQPPSPLASSLCTIPIVRPSPKVSPLPTKTRIICYYLHAHRMSE